MSTTKNEKNTLTMSSYTMLVVVALIVFFFVYINYNHIVWLMIVSSTALAASFVLIPGIINFIFKKWITLNTNNFNKKADIYLNSFKKDFEERTIPENILVECIFKLEFLNSNDNRFIGAAEATLIMEGYLKIEKEFDYLKKETYKEHIIKLIKKYLSDKNLI